MDEITLITKDGNPVIAKKSVLVKRSSVFSHLINDIKLTEIQLDDFTPEIVVTFLTLLEHELVPEHVLNSQFRESFKIATVFKVDWLTESYTCWFTWRITSTVYPTDYTTMTFLFEESLYVLKKWQLTTFIETLVLRARFQENTLFITRYIQEKQHDQLTEQEWRWLLLLGGSNVELFVGLVTQNLSGKKSLEGNTRYLLQHINLPLCVQENADLYHTLTESIAGLGELTTQDLRLLLQLTTEATRTAERSRYNIDRVRISNCLGNDPSTLSKGFVDNIVRFIADDKPTSMYVVLDYLIETAFFLELTSEETTQCIAELDKIVQINRIQKVSTSYLDLFTSAFALSDSHRKYQLISLLESVKKSHILSSKYDIIHNITGEEKTAFIKPLKIEYVRKYVFKAEFGLFTNCIESYSCGFIINKTIKEYELSKEKEDYESNEIHLHDSIKAGNMNCYWVHTGTTKLGKEVKIAHLVTSGSRWSKWFWFNGISDWKKTQICVDYNISDCLAAKF